jgi:hypothetical protein
MKWVAAFGQRSGERRIRRILRVLRQSGIGIVDACSEFRGRFRLFRRLWRDSPLCHDLHLRLRYRRSSHCSGGVEFVRSARWSVLLACGLTIDAASIVALEYLS